MDLRSIQAGEGGAGAALARAGLSVLSAGYAAAGAVRDALLSAGLLSTARLQVPVVSVGNLTAGGTGKTPFVVWLARHALNAGRRPAVLSRGYGHRPEGSSLSDEGNVLRERLGADFPQVEDPNRRRGGRALLAAHPEVDLVLLDDGFQHRRLARDVDVVLLDATEPFGFGRRLPRGLLREAPAALARAHAIVLTRSERVRPAELKALRARIESLAPKALVGVARTQPRALVASKRGEIPVDALRGVSVHAYSGIGNPAAFEAMLVDLGATVVGATRAPDHHAMTSESASRVTSAAAEEGAALVVTTVKDLVKWRALPDGPARVADARVRVLALDVDTEVVEGERELLALVLSARRADRSASAVPAGD